MLANGTDFIGGAAISLKTTKELLSKNNEVVEYSCKMIRGLHKLDIYKRYYYHTQEKQADKFIQKEKPDLIITQLYFTPVAVRLAKKYGIKVIVFLRSYEHLQLQNRLFHQKALLDADIVIANSNFMRNRFLKELGVDSVVIYPPVETEKYPKRECENIIFLSPSKRKGIDFVKGLIKALPNEHFEIIKGLEHRETLKRIANAKVVLVPSVWEEPFGRIPVEAIQQNTPVISSDRGGLPESNLGIILPLRKELWIKAIQNIKPVNCREKAIKKFGIKRYQREITKIFLKSKKNADLKPIPF